MSLDTKTMFIGRAEQSWGQFNSGIGIVGQFQIRNWNCLFEKKIELELKLELKFLELELNFFNWNWNWN